MSYFIPQSQEPKYPTVLPALDCDPEKDAARIETAIKTKGKIHGVHSYWIHAAEVSLYGLLVFVSQHPGLKKTKTFWELVQVCDLSGTRTLQNILWKLLVTANKASILFGWSFVSVKELMVYFDCSRKQQNNCFRSNVPTPQNHFAFSNHVFVRRKGEKKKQSFSIFFF